MGFGLQSYSLEGEKSLVTRHLVSKHSDNTQCSAQFFVPVRQVLFFSHLTEGRRAQELTVTG